MSKDRSIKAKILFGNMLSGPFNRKTKLLEKDSINAKNISNNKQIFFVPDKNLPKSIYPKISFRKGKDEAGDKTSFLRFHSPNNSNVNQLNVNGDIISLQNSTNNIITTSNLNKTNKNNPILVTNDGLKNITKEASNANIKQRIKSYRLKNSESTRNLSHVNQNDSDEKVLYASSTNQMGLGIKHKKILSNPLKFVANLEKKNSISNNSIYKSNTNKNNETTKHIKRLIELKNKTEAPSANDTKSDIKNEMSEHKLPEINQTDLFIKDETKKRKIYLSPPSLLNSTKDGSVLNTLALQNLIKDTDGFDMDLGNIQSPEEQHIFNVIVQQKMKVLNHIFEGISIEKNRDFTGMEVGDKFPY